MAVFAVKMGGWWVLVAPASHFAHAYWSLNEPRPTAFAQKQSEPTRVTLY